MGLGSEPTAAHSPLEQPNPWLCLGHLQSTEPPTPGRPPTLLPAHCHQSPDGQKDTRPAHRVSDVTTSDQTRRASSMLVRWGLSKAPELCTRPGHVGGRWRRMR